jgi:hypothetical protein
MLSPGSGSGGPDQVMGTSLPSARTRKSRLPSALAGLADALTLLIEAGPHQHA